ncbi:MAG: M48 family metallopeptidase, partial [Planctomycetes bacterium]|nr:M48 family metallopeptidase [Planctomycetota bacterium]
AAPAPPAPGRAAAPPRAAASQAGAVAIVPAVAAPGVDLDALRTDGERALRIVCLVFTVLIYLALVAWILGIIYFGILVLMGWIALAMRMCHVRGNGVRAGLDQLPHVHESARRAARSLGLEGVPDVYVIQEGGILNAFAAKWAFRRYVVVYADLVDACGDGSAELDMVVAHEMGHLALGHITWQWILLPSMFVPFLSQAYSRACEYSSDRCGWTACRDKQAAVRGLVILAAGGQCGRMASIEAFLRQRQETEGFWQTVIELFSTHPWLTRRAEAMQQLAAGGSGGAA